MAIAVILSFTSLPSDSAEGAPADPAVITGDIALDMGFGDGEWAEIAGNVILHPGVTITFEAGSVLVIDESFSIAGGEGSGFSFEEGSSIYVSDTEMDVPDDLNLTINGKIAYRIGDFGVGAQSETISVLAALTIDKGTAIASDSLKMTFDDGFSATARITMDMPDTGILGMLLGGIDLDTMEADVEIKTGSVSVAYAGIELDLDGTATAHVSVKESSAGSDIEVDWKGECAVTSENGGMDCSSEAKLAFLISSGSIESVKGTLGIDLVCDEMSQSDNLFISGLKAGMSAAIDDNRMEADMRFDADTITYSSQDGTITVNAAGLDSGATLEFNVLPLIDWLQSPNWGIEELITEMRLVADADLTAELLVGVFNERGYPAVASAQSPEAILKVDATDGIYADLDFRADDVLARSDTNAGTELLDADDVDVDATYDGSLTLHIKAGASVLEDIDDGHGYEASTDGISISAVIIGPVIEAELEGDAVYKRFNEYAEDSRFTFTDATATVSAAIGEDLDLKDYEVGAFAGDVVLIYDGIALDCGRMSYEPVTGMFASQNVLVSGTSTDAYSEVLAIDGMIADFRISLDGDCAFSSHVLTYTLNDGSVLRDTMAVSGGKVAESIEISGRVPYNIANGYSTVTGNHTRAAVEGLPITLGVSGSGTLTMTSLDAGIMTLTNGSVSVNGYIRTDDLLIMLNGFSGARIAVFGPDGGMKVEAEPGYTLDPSTYDGFAIIDGWVALDESKIVDGRIDLTAVSVPDRYRLTVDGDVVDAVYRSMVVREVPEDVMWFADADGNVYGSIQYGEWSFWYDVLGDLELKSVKGKEVVAEPGKTVKSPSDSFYFEIPSSGQSASIATPSGLIFGIDPHMPASDRVAVSVSKTTFDGYRAYDITSDVRVHAMFPVSDDNARLYHIVNGNPVEMASVFVLREDGSMLLEADLSSYSVYFVTEEPEKEKSGSNAFYIIAAVIVIVVAIVAVVMLKRSRSGA